MSRALPEQPGYRSCPHCAGIYPQSFYRKHKNRWSSWCRSCRAVDRKRYKDNRVRGMTRHYAWTAAEKRALQELYPVMGTRIIREKNWTHRTKSGVVQQAIRMGVRKNSAR